LHGPDVSNFRDVYADLDNSGGAMEVRSVDELAAAVEDLLSDTAKMRKMARAAADAVERIGGASETILRALEPWMPRSEAKSP
jgi:3-deoxy-D-manno-octulosonic-acid transferase